MKRAILQELKSWKESKDRKPLILNGARQVGKTWVLREFARQEYQKEAYLVCRKNELLRNVFTQDFDVKRILLALSALSNVDITPGDTLIILDEVQDIPEILESLKYFCEEMPDYHIAVAGSLLGISLHPDVSYPVGKVDKLDVYPMNFSEFLWALGEDELCNLLIQKEFNVTNLLHEKYINLLRQYYYVGGMPEAVKAFADTTNLELVRKIQRDILLGYEMDFSKHAPTEQVPRIRMVWQSIPSQLFKDNKKFIYGVLKKGARATEYELSIQWLVQAGLVYKVPRCTKVALPLGIYEDLSAFKLYLLDVGLLGAMVQIEPKQILVDNRVFSEYKGGMTEQFVLQEMRSLRSCSGIQFSDIYYHKTDDSRLELDFVIQHQGMVLPIEVKAGVSIRANSLANLLHQTPDLQALRCSMLPFKVQEQLTNVPLYAVSNWLKD